MILKLEGAIIKHNGIMADKSTKITLYLNEMSPEEVVNLYELVKIESVDIIICPPDSLKEIAQK